LSKKWDLIPEGIDILLLHGPPHGYGDFSPYDHVHTGSPSLLTRIEQIRPKLVVAGHIHNGRGVYHIPDRTVFVNVAYVDEQYRPTGLPPIIIELKG
jgi:Icc-related predicted phosphoesterase